MQDNPTIPTLSDQKKPFFPTERKKHPQTTRKKEEQTFSLLSKESILPYRRKKPIAEVQNDSSPSCQKPCIIFPTEKKLPSLPQKEQRLSPHR